LNERPPQLLNVATLPRKMNRSPSRYATMGQNSTQKTSLLVLIFQLCVQQ